MFVSNSEFFHKFRGKIDVALLIAMTTSEQLVEGEAVWEAIVVSTRSGVTLYTGTRV